MFQSFDVLTDPTEGTERVSHLRAYLQDQNLDGFIVPRADEHQGEYVPPRAERLSWLTGFTGSAGAAIILQDHAALFVDGRYTLQAKTQVDTATFTIESLIDNPPAKWLASQLSAGSSLGFDPWLHTITEVRALKEALDKADGRLVAMTHNAVDAIWPDQPPAPADKIEIHPIGFAGELASDKLARLAALLEEANATHAVLTDPSSLAWAFNIRGSDVPHTPLALGFAIISAKDLPFIFLDGKKLSIETEAYLTQLANVQEPSQLEAHLAALAAEGAHIALDPALAADKLRMIIEEHGGTVVELADPTRLPRAVKNEAELAGARAAHRRDGAAIVKFLHWLDMQQPGSIDEIAAVGALENFRRLVGEETQMKLRDISFDTISGAGPNGAIVHYRVTTKTNRKLHEGELYLVDSGGQYQDGTTDITRTIAIGQPDEEMRRCATLVLKGMIAISMLRFPPGTRGSDIDILARQSLWRAGLDYAHGTGHGVGSYLAVHEGPQRIAKTGTQPLLTGMIISNEPGYYKTGHYGIRLENLIAVSAPEAIDGGEIAMHSFETLTLAPFDRRLIRTDLLEADERRWLDAYHAWVLEEIGPMVDGPVLKWLQEATAPL